MTQKTVKSSANTFGAFLQAIQTRGIKDSSQPDLALRIMQIVRENACSVPELIKKTGAKPGQVISSLGELEHTGLIVLSGDQEKIANLTRSGVQVLEDYEN